MSKSKERKERAIASGDSNVILWHLYKKTAFSLFKLGMNSTSCLGLSDDAILQLKDIGPRGLKNIRHSQKLSRKVIDYKCSVFDDCESMIALGVKMLRGETFKDDISYCFPDVDVSAVRDFFNFGGLYDSDFPFLDGENPWERNLITINIFIVFSDSFFTEKQKDTLYRHLLDIPENKMTRELVLVREKCEKMLKIA